MGGIMQFSFAFKHMEASEPLQSYTQQKLGEKISKFVTKPIEARVTFSVDRHKTATAHCHLVGGDGFNIEVEHACEDMYGSIDRITDKLESQLRKHKEKLKDHRNRSVAKSIGQETGEEEVEEVSTMEEAEAVDAGDIVKMQKAKK
jgi:putative sigma-54 modulation protein